MKKNAVFFSISFVTVLISSSLWYFCSTPQNPDTFKPKNIAYDSTEYIIYIDESFKEIAPDADAGGKPDTFTIEPSLPEGLFFNYESGIISGVAKDTLSRTLFTITASNKNGSDSITVAITVLAPPEFVIQPEDVAVFKGEPALISVAVTGAGPLTYKWLKDSSEIEDADSAVLEIDSVLKSDTGIYLCSVTDTNGRETTSDPAHCTISTDTTAPVIEASPSTRSAVAGESVVLSVTAKGTSLSFQWQKNGKDITEAEMNYYQIDSFSVKDTGVYRAIVTNKYGSDTSAGALLILGDTSSILYEIDVSIEGNGRIRYNNRYYTTDTVLILFGGSTEMVQYLPDSGYFIRYIAINDTTDSISIVNGATIFEEIAEDCSIDVSFDSIPSDFLLPDSFSLTVSANDTSAGSITVEPLLDKYEEGDSVTITAVPEIGYLFTGWGDTAIDTTNPLTFVVTKDDTLTATFDPAPEIAEWTVSPGESLNAIIAEVSGSPIPGAIIKPEPGEYDENTVIVEGEVEIEIKRR